MATKRIKENIIPNPEGLSPIYKGGRIIPETRGLGPEFEKDIKTRIMPKERRNPIPKKKEQPRIINIRHLA